MSLLTSTTIILDYMPYEPSSKTLSPWRMKSVQHGFFLPLENVHVTWTPVSHEAMSHSMLLEQIRTGISENGIVPRVRAKKMIKMITRL
jgi:hypothetical protein